MLELSLDKIINSNEARYSPELVEKFNRLWELLSRFENVIVAYSGGVDSTFLLKAAYDVLGKNVLAVIGDSESIARAELDNAIKMALDIGAKYRLVKTTEMINDKYLANNPDRCFHCKKTLFKTLTELAETEGYTDVIEGSNFDDIDDYRPGTKAVELYKVHSPLKEAKLTKEEIRTLSKAVDLPSWDKPAAPCLSSRIPYGMEVNTEKLKRIEEAEKFLRELGLVVLRVRDHNDVARIEVPREISKTLLEGDTPEKITDYFKSLGYKFVALDLLGFRSGSLNEVL